VLGLASLALVAAQQSRCAINTAREVQRELAIRQASKANSEICDLQAKIDSLIDKIGTDLPRSRPIANSCRILTFRRANAIRNIPTMDSVEHASSRAAGFGVAENDQPTLFLPPRHVAMRQGQHLGQALNWVAGPRSRRGNS